MQILIVLFWIFFGFWCAAIARTKGRNPLLWFGIGLGIGLIGVLIIFFLPKKKIENEPLPEKPSLLPQMEKKWYYLTHNHEQMGPYSDLLENMKNGEITENSLIWTEGMETWKKLKELPQLYRELPP